MIQIGEQTLLIDPDHVAAMRDELANMIWIMALIVHCGCYDPDWVRELSASMIRII
jgi:hypothetical protein